MYVCMYVCMCVCVCVCVGPGRIHHCMRTIGMAETALALMIKRCHKRAPFKTALATKGVCV